MTQIDYLGKTGIYTGATTNYTFYSPVNIYKGQTLLIFLQCSSAGLHPSPPADWVFVDMVDTTMGDVALSSIGTMLCYYCQPTETLLHPQWEINGLSPNFNSGYGLFFSGVTLIQSQVINAYTHASNPSTQNGTNGFITTVNNTAIVQAAAVMKYPVSTPFYFNTNSWNSNPSLTWTDIYSGSGAIKVSTSGYAISHGCGLSMGSPKGKYTSFSYAINTSNENLTIDVALSPVGSKPNVVLNGLESF